MTAPAPLTLRDIDTLDALRCASDDSIRYGGIRGNHDGWVMPMDCGGGSRSHHSQTLKKLAGRGLCERKKYGTAREKGSCRYRINEAGRAFMKEHHAKAAQAKTNPKIEARRSRNRRLCCARSPRAKVTLPELPRRPALPCPGAALRSAGVLVRRLARRRLWLKCCRRTTAPIRKRCLPPAPAPRTLHFVASAPSTNTRWCPPTTN